MNYEITEEQSKEIDRLELEACEREEFVEKMLACSDYTLEEIVDWTDEDYTLGATFDENLDEFERFQERDARTGKQSATLVEKVITFILKEKATKRKTMKGVKIPRAWFNALITKTCYDNNISEGHIRAVGVWNVNDDVDEETPKD